VADGTAHTYELDMLTGLLGKAICGQDGERAGATLCADCRAGFKSSIDGTILESMNEFGTWLLTQPLSTFNLTSRELVIEFVSQSPSWIPKEEPTNG